MKTIHLFSLLSVLTILHAWAEDTNLVASRSVARPLPDVRQAILSYGLDTTNHPGFYILHPNDGDVPGVSYKVNLLDCRYELIPGKMLFNGDVVATSIGTNATRLEVRVPLLPSPKDSTERARIKKHLSAMADQIVTIIERKR